MKSNVTETEKYTKPKTLQQQKIKFLKELETVNNSSKEFFNKSY